MASNSFILPKVERAIHDALEAKAFSWGPHVNPGMSAGPLDDDQDARPDSTNLPSVTCEASSASVITPNVATYRVNCTVHVAHGADDTNRDTAMDQAGDVFDYIFDSAFLDALSVAGLTAFGIYQTDQSKTIKGRKWVASQSFDVICAGSTIS